MARTCGECVACCVYLRIDDPDLQKDAMTHCPHVATDEPEDPGKRVCYTGTGCTIYDAKPEVCNGYKCEWLQGHGKDHDRPDRCGILIDRAKRVGNAIECKPLWPTAADEVGGHNAMVYIAQSRGMCALVLSFYERRLVRVIGREP